jgi:acetylornithine deacetylase
MLEKILKDLIALPSVNPAFAEPGSKLAGEESVADYLASLGSRWGLDVDFKTVLAHRENVFIRLLPQGKTRRRVLLAPHLDTVSVRSEVQLQPRTMGGKMFGRGACDTKGSVAAMMTALGEVAKSKQRPRETEIIFVGLVDEENAQAGSRALVASNFKADLAIVGEPTELEVVTAHKGDIWLEFETTGKAAHGAKPELGVNAVHEMARIVHLLETRYAEELRERSHPLLRHPTINVGQIAGGSQPNIVPNCCTMSADRRTIPGETELTVRREIKALLAKHGLKAKVSSQKSNPCLPMATDPGLPLVQELTKAAGVRKTIGVDYFCDASILSAGGIPSVVFGPGNIAQAHTTDEWISLKSLRGAADILRRFLQRLS